MLTDGGHRQASGQQIQPTDTRLEGRVQGGLADVAAMRHTGDLAAAAGSASPAAPASTVGSLISRRRWFGGPRPALLHGARDSGESAPVAVRGSVEASNGRARKQPAVTDVRWQRRRKRPVQAGACLGEEQAQGAAHQGAAGPGAGGDPACAAPDRPTDALRRAIAHDLPERGFDQHGRPPVCETARDLGDAGDFAPRPASRARRRQYQQRQETSCAWHARRPDCSGAVW